MREMQVGRCSPAANVSCAMMMTGSVFCFGMGREDWKRQAAASCAAAWSHISTLLKQKYCKLANVVALYWLALLLLGLSSAACQQ